MKGEGYGSSKKIAAKYASYDILKDIPKPITQMESPHSKESNQSGEIDDGAGKIVIRDHGKHIVVPMERNKKKVSYSQSTFDKIGVEVREDIYHSPDDVKRAIDGIGSKNRNKKGLTLDFSKLFPRTQMAPPEKKTQEIDMTDYIITINGAMKVPTKWVSFDKIYDCIVGKKPRTQMESSTPKESNQGLVDQNSVKNSNTIITRDEGETVSAGVAPPEIDRYFSAEKVHTFESLIDRWMALPAVTVSTTNDVNSLLRAFYLPESLYTLAECAPNLLPFQTFIYSNLDIDVKFVVNAQAFQTGKVVASVKFDSYQADMVQSTVMAALTRDHVILDMASNVEGTLKVPFLYHRGFVRNVRNDKSSLGVRPSKYATVYLHVLSPLRTGKDSLTEAFITPYFKITRAKFAAMSYQVKVQMDGLINLAEEIIEVENKFVQFGKSFNQDKPTQNSAIVTIPRPRMNFPHGVGISDAIPLRVQPNKLTSFEYIKPLPTDPRTLLDIARCWGLKTSFTWSATQGPNSELWAGSIDPCNRTYQLVYNGVPTPLEYVCGMFNFWSGSIEYRFDFVSNKFHNGAVMITIEYGRPVEATQSACHKASTYSKTFHLGDQRSVIITVPYIYDTVMRRTTDSVFDPNFDIDESQSMIIKEQAMSLRPEVKTTIRVTVMNDLRPVQTVSQEIDVLVFIRASKSFQLHGLKQQSFTLTRELTNTSPAIDSFPRDGYNVVEGASSSTRRKRDVKNTEHDVPKLQANRWNEYSPDNLPIRPLNIHNIVKGPITQMDDGFKEAADPTADFSSGLSNLHIQTSEKQWDIKDILRRPTWLVYRHLVKTYVVNNTSFFLPVMPPSREMAYHATQATEFCQMVGQTPQASIMDLFRFWRGSSRYTIILHGNYTEPIFVSYAPHSGTRIIGNQTIGIPSSETLHGRPIFTSGLSTEVLIPSINPTLTVEVPYDTENNWTLTFEEDAQRNYAWRDKGDTNAGHLVITTSEDVNISIAWSAGDDFCVTNYYGIPVCKKNSNSKTLSDAYARVQMDLERYPNDDIGLTSNFRLKENTNSRGIFSEINTNIRRIMTPSNVIRATVATIPMIGPALAVAPTISRVEESLSKMNSVADSVEPAVEKTLETFSKIDSLCTTTQALVEKFTNFAQIFMGDSAVANLKVWSERIMDLILDSLTAFSEQNFKLFAIGITKFILKVFNIPQYVTKYSQAIFNWFMAYAVGPITQAPSSQATLAGIIAGIVAVAYNTKSNCEFYWVYGYERIFRVIFSPSTVGHMNQVLRFFHTTFDLIKETVMRLLGYVNPEAEALQLLSKEDGMIQKFITTSQMMLCEANTNLMLHPHYRTKFWYNVVQAHQIQKILTTVPTNVVSPPLHKLCLDVIRVGNEKFVDLACSPVRYEPFVICIEGSHGIGKSHLTDTLIGALLESVGFNRAASGWTYTRCPGSKFWSGYRDQPAIVYDDWLNLNDTEAMVQQVSELYQLKSTCTFIPEMAHLEEKRIKANPMLVVLLTNGAFPSSISNVAHHPQAIFRRRDLVLHARVKSEYEGVNPRDMDTEIQHNYSHLEFTMFSDATNKNSKSSTYKGWEETKCFLQQSFQRYHAQEELNVKQRIEILKQQIGIDASETISFEDPFSLLYKTIHFTEVNGPTNNGWIPSERLSHAVTEIIDGLRRNPDDHVVVVPPSPENIFQSNTSLQSWEDVPKFILSGAILNIGVVSKLTQWTIKGVESIIMKLLDYSCVAPSNYCAVCMENKEIVIGCSSNVEHYVCMECWTTMQSLGTTNCPVCRDERMVSVVTTREGILYFILQWIAHSTQDYVVPLLKILEKSFHSRIHKLYLILGGITKLVYALHSDRDITGDLLQHTTSIIVATQLIDSQEEWFDAITHPTMSETIVGGIVRPLSSIMTQADDWEVYVPPSERRYSGEVTVQVQEHVVNEWLTNEIPSRVPQCLHSLLFDNIENLAYFDIDGVDTFRLLHEDVMYAITVNKCGTECFWNTERMNEFVNNYKNVHRRTIEHVIRCYLSALQAEPTQFLKKIPKCFRPNAQAQIPIVQPDINMGEWWRYLTGKVDEYRIPLMVSAGAISVIAALYKWFYKQDISLTAIQSGLKDYDPSHTRHVRQAQRIVHAMRTPQSENTLYDSLLQYIQRNYITIIIDHGAEHSRMTAVGVFNHHALLPRHYVDVLYKAYVDGAKIYIQPTSAFSQGGDFKRREYTWSNKDFQQSDKTDMAVFTLPTSFELFKDIRKFFMLNKDLERGLNSAGRIVLNPNRKGVPLAVYGITLQGYLNHVTVNNKGVNEDYYDMVRYDFSRVGACGSLILIEDSQRPIVAFHSAGQGEEMYGEGYGVLITQEILASIFNDSNIVTQAEDFSGESIDNAKFIFGPHCDVDYLGSLEPSKEPHIPAKSKIKKSLIYHSEGLETYTEPTILSKTDLRYTHERTPLYYGVIKHGKKTRDFSTDLLSEVEDIMWNKYYQNLTPNIVKPTRLNTTQAVLGKEGIEGYEAMSLNTSAGYPWTVQGDTSKEGWININDDRTKVTLDSRLISEIVRKEKLRRNGIVPITYFVDTLKDERKLSSKVLKEGGTRVFCASPQDYTIAMRQNLLHFCAAFFQKRFQLAHAVGINPHGMEWTRLFKNLTQFGLNNIVTLDYSNFGPAFNAKVAKIASNLIIRWTMENVENVDRKELEALMYECIQSVHICSNTVYRQTCGSPSGAAITTVINSIVNLVYLHCVWKLIVGDIPNVWEEFYENVVIYVYGDDVIMAVSNKYKDKFNTITIHDEFARWGIVSTSAAKDESLTPTVSIWNATFLKRSWKLHPFKHQVYLAPLDWRSVNDIPQWMWVSPDAREATYINAEAAIMEAYEHGPQMFQEFKDKINKSLGKRKIKPVSRSWNELDKLYYN